MIATYKPSDSETQSWTFDPGKVKGSAAEVIEKRFGGTYQEFQVAIQQGQTRARRVLLWYLIWQAHPTLRFEDMPDFCFDEFTLDYTTAELLELRERIGKARMEDEGKRQQMLEAFEIAIDEAMERENAAPPVGKAS
jgi:hypothetical protein